MIVGLCILKNYIRPQMDLGFIVYKLEIMCSKLARYILAADQINEAIFFTGRAQNLFPMKPNRLLRCTQNQS